MKIIISGSGIDPDDDLVEYYLTVENADFKGTIAFYEYKDVFKEFSSQIMSFPFDFRGPIEFNVDGFDFVISLADNAGRINLQFNIQDEEGNRLMLNDQSVETNELHGFASKLECVDFSIKQRIEWTSVNK